MKIDDVGRGREVEVARIRELFRVAIPGNEVRNEKRMPCVGLLHEVCITGQDSRFEHDTNIRTGFVTSAQQELAGNNAALRRRSQHELLNSSRTCFVLHKMTVW
jgi:hypothetical protein